jgi:PRC-barrel domain
MAFEDITYEHLEELSRSDFEIVNGEPNIIGWDVKNGQGQKIGEVDNLLFNPQSRKVRYLVLNMDSNKLHLDKGRKVLVPIGIADLYRKSDKKDDRDDRRNAYDPAYDGDIVVLKGVSIAQLNALPLYEKGHLSHHIEIAIKNIFDKRGSDGSSSNASAYNTNEFYEHENFNEDRFYKRADKKRTTSIRTDDDLDE